MRVISIFLLVLLLGACGVKVPFTNEIRDEFELETDKDLRKVQFFTSETIILEKSKSSGNQSTTEDGALVTSSSNTQDRIIIPINTKCVFDGFGTNKELMLRFELGAGKFLLFTTRGNQPSGRYYIKVDADGKGGKLSYGNETYYTTSVGSSSYLLVVLKKLQKTRRKDRVVKGMKV